jgi:curved DNA-binding protein CbpA
MNKNILFLIILNCFTGLFAMEERPEAQFIALTPYDFLGLEKKAESGDITKNYRKLAYIFHPDKCKKPMAEECFKAIYNAYEVLTNDDRVKDYYDKQDWRGWKNLASSIVVDSEIMKIHAHQAELEAALGDNQTDLDRLIELTCYTCRYYERYFSKVSEEFQKFLKNLAVANYYKLAQLLLRSNNVGHQRRAHGILATAFDFAKDSEYLGDINKILNSFRIKRETGRTNLQARPDSIPQSNTIPQMHPQFVATDPYAILGVDRGEAISGINDAYLKLRVQYRIDRLPKGSQERGRIEQHFMPIENAHRILSDPTTRKIYNEKGFAGLATHEVQINEQITTVIKKYQAQLADHFNNNSRAIRSIKQLVNESYDKYISILATCIRPDLIATIKSCISDNYTNLITVCLEMEEFEDCMRSATKQQWIERVLANALMGSHNYNYIRGLLDKYNSLTQMGQSRNKRTVPRQQPSRKRSFQKSNDNAEKTDHREQAPQQKQARVEPEKEQEHTSAQQNEVANGSDNDSIYNTIQNELELLKQMHDSGPFLLVRVHATSTNYFCKQLQQISCKDKRKNAAVEILRFYQTLAEKFASDDIAVDTIMDDADAIIKSSKPDAQDRFALLQAQISAMQGIQNPASFDENAFLKEQFEQHS